MYTYVYHICMYSVCTLYGNGYGVLRTVIYWGLYGVDITEAYLINRYEVSDRERGFSGLESRGPKGFV